MLAFARGRPDTRVFTMLGEVNLAATRNVVLRSARPGAVLMIDGDVAVERDFAVAALAELARSSADAVFGRLPEILYDRGDEPIGCTADRYRVTERGYHGLIYGMVMLGPNVVARGFLYDETLRRSEDLDLGLRIASQHRILGLPMVMGIHHSVSYFAPSRIGKFYREAYARPLGCILRKHAFRPHRLWSLRQALCGHALGFGLQMLLIAALLLRSPAMISLALGLVGLDLARFAWQGRCREYLANRIVAPWQILYGFILPEAQRLSYQVEARYP
jgi:hypothetical protein